MKDRSKKIWESGYVQVFLLAYLTAMLSFAVLLIRGEGIFTLGNDFNEQQIPFHMLVNRALKSGNTGWNWSIDLGSSFVGALGFYVLGSPFAWISFLFPAESYPCVVAWLYMTKYAAAAACAYGYLKRFAGKKYAALAALLYAFSGFQSVNLIFHHFHDAAAFFPLMLTGYEKLAREGKKGALALGVATLTGCSDFLDKSALGQLTTDEFFVTENDAVAAEIESLESGSGAVEERARMRLGMVRKDEVLFRFVPKGEKKDIEADLIRESGKKGKPNYFAPKRSNLYTDGVIPPKHESGK